MLLLWGFDGWVLDDCELFVLVLVCVLEVCVLFELVLVLGGFDGSDLAWDCEVWALLVDCELLVAGVLVEVRGCDGSELVGVRLLGCSDGPGTALTGAGITTIGAGAGTGGAEMPMAVPVEPAPAPGAERLGASLTGSIGAGVLGAAALGAGSTVSGRSGSVTIGPEPMRAGRPGSAVNVVAGGSGRVTRSSGGALTGLPGAGAGPGLLSLRGSLLSLWWVLARAV